MLEYVNPLDYTDPQYVAAQLVKLKGMKREVNDVMALATSVPDVYRMMTALQVYQTIIMQEDARLKRKYPQETTNLWRHTLIGSSISRPRQEDFADYPGGDSVEQFVARLKTDYPVVLRELEAKLADLRTRYPDHKRYAWYHLAMGSSEHCDFMDFPGEDSLERFTRKLYERIVPRQDPSPEEEEVSDQE